MTFFPIFKCTLSIRVPLRVVIFGLPIFSEFKGVLEIISSVDIRLFSTDFCVLPFDYLFCFRPIVNAPV